MMQIKAMSKNQLKLLLFIFIVCAFLTGYLWYTRPVHIYEWIGNSPSDFNEIRRETLIFSEKATTQTSSISTRDPGEIERTLSFLNQYPINRQTN